MKPSKGINLFEINSKIEWRDAVERFWEEFLPQESAPFKELDENAEPSSEGFATISTQLLAVAATMPDFRVKRTLTEMTAWYIKAEKAYWLFTEGFVLYASNGTPVPSVRRVAQSIHSMYGPGVDPAYLNRHLLERVQA